MARDYERKIVEQEIERHDAAYRSAQERYGQTGSKSTFETMARHDVLSNVLSDWMYGSRDASKSRMIDTMTGQLRDLKRQVEFFRAGAIIPDEAAVKLLDIIMR